MDDLAHQLGQSKSWIFEHALTEWIAIEEERHRLTLEAMADVRTSHTISQESVSAWVDSLETEHQFPCPSELAQERPL